MTERVGLLGWPVAHSLSPAMHNAAFATLGLDWHYDLLPVPPDRFEDEVARLIVAGYRGFNVTIPHKQAAFRLPQISVLTPEAEAIDAVNTLVVLPDGTLRADNTDWLGFADDLDAHRVRTKDAVCLILGTGGSAQAIEYALDEYLCALPPTFVSRTPGDEQNVIGYGDLASWTARVRLVINCTPVGMSPHVNYSPWPADVPFPPKAVLYDLVYNPPVTRLMIQAQAAGARALGGLGMLVHQGALAFEQWTGIAPPIDVMRAAAEAALKNW